MKQNGKEISYGGSGGAFDQQVKLVTLTFNFKY